MRLHLSIEPVSGAETDSDSFSSSSTRFSKTSDSVFAALK